jgi:hypothetical protein
MELAAVPPPPPIQKLLKYILGVQENRNENMIIEKLFYKNEHNT